MIRDQVTIDTYRRHLAGERAIGIYPLLEDGTCWWAAVDFDRARGNLAPEEIDRLALHDARRFAEECDRFGLNRLWLERSKKKGTHAWAFFEEPVPARDIRRIFSAALDAAHIVDYEIFPKQDQLTEAAPWGNYLNLPFPGGDNPHGRQMMLDPVTEAPVPLLSFLQRVERFPADLALILAELPEAPAVRTFEGVSSGGVRRAVWYPCSRPLLTINLAEGEGRNELGFLLAKRLHMSPMSDASRPLFDAWNAANSPPLSDHELDRLWEQGHKYESMGCEQIRAWNLGAQDAIRKTCVETCPIHPSKGLTNYHRLRKWETEPPIYYLGVGADDVRLSPDELWDHNRVRKAVMAQTNRVVPRLKRGEWEDVLSQLLAGVEIIEVPPEATESGRLWAGMADFFALRIDDGERIDNRPVEDGEWVFFKEKALRAHLKTQGLQPKAQEMWEVLEAHGARKSASKKLSGKVHSVLSIPLQEITDG